MVAVELQLRSDLLFFSVYCLADSVQHQVHRLLCRSFVGYNTVVVQITDHRQIQYALLGLNIGNIGHPFAIRCFSVKVPVEKILVFVYLLAYLLPLPAATNFGQQAVFLYGENHSLGEWFKRRVMPMM